MNTQINMIFTAIVASCVIATTLAAGAEYLPPNKGYNYDKPSIPFPGNQPTPPPGGFRPPTSLPTKRPPNGYIPPPTNKPYNPPPTGPSHDHPHDEHHHHHEPGMPFDFSYAVNEDGNDYSHNAISDGDVTRGMYRVALPDGRTQVVKYTADWKNGFNAEVSYEGEAKYPDQPSADYAASPVSRPGQQYVPPNQGGGYQY